MTLSLRPLEWFNLAKRHGWARFLLHDDFYDADGTATQPEVAVEQPDRFPAPSLADVAGDAESLLDYAVTRWYFVEELDQKWRDLPAQAVLLALNRRFDASCNLDVRSVLLEVASLLGSSAEALVLRAWDEYPDGVPFPSLVQATAACLPIDEGFARAESALVGMPERTRRECFFALAHFRSPRVLQWIEANAAEPTIEAWGQLAASSSFSWPKAQAWLAAGRPLSLIAVDALLAIADPRTPLLRNHRPTLGAAPGERTLQQVLEAAVIADPVPRMRQRVGTLLTKLSTLTPSSGPS